MFARIFSGLAKAIYYFVLAVVTIIVLSITTEFVTTYIEKNNEVDAVYTLHKAQVYSEQVLELTEEILEDKQLVEQENEDLKNMSASLNDRLTQRENIIADRTQTIQDMAMTNRNLSIQLRRLNSLTRWMMRQLEDEETKEKASNWYDELMRDGEYE